MDLWIKTCPASCTQKNKKRTFLICSMRTFLICFDTDQKSIIATVTQKISSVEEFLSLIQSYAIIPDQIAEEMRAELLSIYNQYSQNGIIQYEWSTSAFYGSVFENTNHADQSNNNVAMYSVFGPTRENN